MWGGGGGGGGGDIYWGRKEEAESKGIAVIFAWASIQERHLKSYVDLYASLGWNCLVSHADFLSAFYPQRAFSLAFVVLNELVEELRIRPCPVVFVAFSGGPKACMYKLFQIIDGTCGGDLYAGEYQLVRNCVSGHIYDSSPVDFTSDLGTRFALHPSILKMPGSSKLVSWVAKGVASGLDALYLTRFESQRVEYWQALYSSVNLGAPFLIICSEKDDLAPYDIICNFAQRLQDLGGDVKLVKLNGTPHIGHYEHYPIQYRAAVTNLLDKAASVFSQKIRLLGERSSMEGMPEEISELICDLQNAAVNSNQSLRRVAQGPSDHFFLPSSAEYHSSSDSATLQDEQKERSICLPNSTSINSPKRFRSRNKKLCFAPAQPPDCVVILDTERKSSVIFEAEKLQIPVVALVDSSMPLDVYKRIAYPVPANDSVQFVYLFCNLITKTFLLEQKRFGGTAREDSAAAIPSADDASKIENHREEVKRIEERESDSVGYAKDEVLVVPYESLTPVSGDGAEIKELLDKLVVLKFNGTLGTELGFDGPNSAIEVCNGSTFLDLIVNQIESLNSKYGCNVPLLLMNTIKTNDDSVKVLEKYPKSNIVMLKSFDGQTCEKESYPSDHDMEFLSLMKGGTLDVLLSQGKEYILVVGSDNVAAGIDPKILKHLVQNKIEYCMEVTPTTSFGKDNDILNSSQQKFQLAKIARNFAPHSMDKFKLVDTRSLWLNLRATKRLVDTDALNFENYSVSKGRETAAGSTIRFFDRAIGINVPQSRFMPINASSDLLILQSDLYTYNDGVLVRNTARTNPVNPSIDLGPEFGQVSDFLSRFRSIPSIIELDSLKVTGDVWFGTDITLKGRVNIVAKPGTRLEIPDGVVLHDKDIRDPKDI